jgi:hypothetical protein
MNNRTQTHELEFWAVAEAVLADVLAKGVLTPNGEASLGPYLTVLPGDIPTRVMINWFFPPEPAHMPPVTHFSWRLWPDELGSRLRGFCNVAFQQGQGWTFYGNSDLWLASWNPALRRFRESPDMQQA